MHLDNTIIAVDFIRRKNPCLAVLNREQFLRLNPEEREKMFWVENFNYKPSIVKLQKKCIEMIEGKINICDARFEAYSLARYDDVFIPKLEGQDWDVLHESLSYYSSTAAGYANYIIEKKRNNNSIISDGLPTLKELICLSENCKKILNSKWTNCGGSLVKGRMIAAFDDEIWKKISIFGTPYFPFDFEQNARTAIIIEDNVDELYFLLGIKKMKTTPVRLSIQCKQVIKKYLNIST